MKNWSLWTGWVSLSLCWLKNLNYRPMPSTIQAMPSSVFHKTNNPSFFLLAFTVVSTWSHSVPTLWKPSTEWDYISLFWTRVQIYRQIKTPQTFLSKATVRLHKMLFNSLMIQTTTPILLLIIPLSLLIASIFIQNDYYDNRQIAAVVLAVPSLYSTCHVQTVLYFTKPYWRFLKGVLRKERRPIDTVWKSEIQECVLLFRFLVLEKDELLQMGRDWEEHRQLDKLIKIYWPSFLFSESVLISDYCLNVSEPMSRQPSIFFWKAPTNCYPNISWCSSLFFF